MAIAWLQTLLIGTKDGVNKSFLLPDIPDPNATRIVYNGRVLYKASATPESTQYTLAGNAVQLGLAPLPADDLWIMYAVETSVLTSSVARIHADFYYTIELRNRSGELLEILQTDVVNLSWKYTAVGGCGECEIVLAREFDNYGDIGLDYDIQIWRDLNPLGEVGVPLPAELPILLGSAQQGARELWYSGFIREIQPALKETEDVTLRCSGYVRQLGTIAVLDYDTGEPLVYNNTDVGEIARDIIDTYVVPQSNIKRTAALGLVPNIGIPATTVQFKSPATEALQGLADLGGNVEWGVRADKEIYFVPRTSVVRQQYFVGDKISLFETNVNADDVVNRLLLYGAGTLFADIKGPNYDSLFADPILRKTIRTRIVVKPFIGSASDLQLWGIPFFAIYGNPQPRGRLQLGASDDWIEGVGHPLGLLRVLGGPQFIERGDALPALLPVLLGETMGGITDQSFRINAISYQPAEGNLNIGIELGEKGSGLADLLNPIQLRLSELRQLL